MNWLWRSNFLDNFHTNFTAIGHFHWFDIPGVQCMTFTLKGSYIHKGIKWLYTQKHTPALQVSTSQCSITANLWSLTVHIYHVMIIVTSGFSKKFFSIIIFRSNCMQLCYFKTSATRNSAIFTCCSLSLIKLQTLWPKKDFKTGDFY